MTTEAIVIDCDGHILEPPDLWETYLEPAYRDRALRIRVGDDGFEYLEIDGQRSTIARQGQLGTLGGMGKRVDEARELRERAMRGEVAPQEVRGIRPSSEQTYLRGAAFGTMDMKERVQLLDREGMAKAVLYPTLGLLWEAKLFDPELSSAYCRAAVPSSVRSPSPECPTAIRVTTPFSRRRRTSTCRWRCIPRSSRSRSTSTIASTSSAGPSGTSISSPVRACNRRLPPSSSSVSSSASRACASSCSSLRRAGSATSSTAPTRPSPRPRSVPPCA